jgi:hypothetical protein
VYFGDSANSRLLQIADLCCSVITAHLLVTYGYVSNSKDKRMLAPFYPLIQGQIVGHGVPPKFSKMRVW